MIVSVRVSRVRLLQKGYSAKSGASDGKKIPPFLGFVRKVRCTVGCEFG